MASPQAQHWEAAAADEILTLIANGTWELVELPPREGYSIWLGLQDQTDLYGRIDRFTSMPRVSEVRVIMPVYIHDITLASKNTALLDQTVLDLSKHFKLRHLGETKFLLGVEIIHDRANRSVSLSQRQYIIDMLECYSMAECNPVGTPLVPGTKLSKTVHPQTQEVPSTTSPP
ncbi:hypothetical protein EST38_g11151 [Candolleomyces aberdarensis]|uniref:Reverse transcriptase Ty1/copia-type domain-containing protein n=1 Tax=Candolleomyces aberdarensis TaxID=2316362 RepID=A0A4Q2D7V8_9AGAR|nr:hypothetical protein EST38_g11151 [Candolleomyces aberdarensis]